MIYVKTKLQLQGNKLNIATLSLNIIDTFTSYREVIGVDEYWFHKDTGFSSPTDDQGIWLFDLGLIRLQRMIPNRFTLLSLARITDDYSNEAEIWIYGIGSTLKPQTHSSECTSIITCTTASAPLMCQISTNSAVMNSKLLPAINHELS